MAKGETKEFTRTKKPRTAAQIAVAKEKKERNEAAAAERLRRLQEEQKRENLFRKNPALKAELEEKARRANEAVAEARRQAVQAEMTALFKKRVEQKYVDDALRGPSSVPLKRWLKDREPTFERVERFFRERPHLAAPSGQVSLEHAKHVA